MDPKHDRLEESRRKIARNQAKKAEAEKRAKAEEAERAAALRDKIIQSKEAEPPKPKVKTMHTLTSEETLSHLSLKYYGHATEPYWRVIYEANKEVIGDNPNRVAPGMELKIPELPDNLKDD